MNTQPSKDMCPKCGGSIPPEAPQGLCPRCVLARVAIPTDAGLKPGERIAPPPLETVVAAFPQLEILELIGVGGMGVVYKARQPKLDRLVALKLLPQSLGSDPAFTERFHREARFLARLNHPNIVSVFDFGQSGGFCFLLLEFVDGVNLRQAMQAGRFSPSEALTIVPALCGALQFAHDQGVLHRDIKPENILLDARGRVKLADFGIAKFVREPGDHRAEVTLTQSGSRLGTPHYMAPEQIEKPSQVDHRADIYSLGVVFYELLTGELPLGRFAAPSEKAALDARVDAIVFRALAKERELRQQSAGQVKTEVEELGSTLGSAAPPAGRRRPMAVQAILPGWAHRLAGWFLGLGALSLIPMFLSWGSPLRVYPVSILLALTGWALFAKIPALRFIALIANALAILFSVMSFRALPQALDHPLLPEPWAFGIPGLDPSVWLYRAVALAHLAAFIAATWVLCHRHVRPVFARPIPAQADPAPNPRPHRFFWAVLGLVVTPAALLTIGLIVPTLMRSGGSIPLPPTNADIPQRESEPGAEVRGLPQALPIGNSSAAALKLHSAWEQLEGKRKQVMAGVIAPHGPEVLAAERDLAVAEAEFRRHPSSALAAQVEYAKAVLELLHRKFEAGAATQAEVTAAELAFRQAVQDLQRVHAQTEVNEASRAVEAEAALSNADASTPLPAPAR